MRVAIANPADAKERMHPRISLAGCVAGFAAVAAGFAEPASQSGVGPPAAEQATVTFTKDVAPILFENCVICHRAGQSGPFELLRYEDVSRRAERIAAVTQRGLMPPWLPEPGYGDFRDERRLTDDEIRIIQQWVTDGATRGDPADLPPSPTFPEGWQLGEPDLIVEMPASYTLPVGGGDVFRNFVVRIPTTETRYVLAVEVRPGNPKVVHHAVMMLDRTSSSRELDAEDPEPGFSGGMDVSVEAHSPGGQFIGWTPGKVPRIGPSDLAWRLEPGTDLVLQLHLLPTGEPEEIRARVGFFFTDETPARTPFMLRLGSKTIDIPAGEANYSLADSYTLPVDVEVLGVYPHAHYLGKEMRAFATLPDGRREWLLWIRAWDFMWQDEYRYSRPVRLPRGTRVSIEYSFDNSENNPHNPTSPPRRVLYGPNSSDEMADLWLQVLAANDDDLAILARNFGFKELNANLAGYRKALEINPDDPAAHADLGLALADLGRAEEAIGELRMALALEPDFANAHTNLGNLLMRLGRRVEAIDHFRQALQARPNGARARYNLGSALLEERDFVAAEANLRGAIEIDPDYAEAHHNLGLALASQGKLEEAIEHFRTAVNLRPGIAGAHQNLANALLSTGQLDEAIREYGRVLEIAPRTAVAHNNLGRALALQNRLDEAISHFRQALAIQPNYPEAQTNLARALARR